MLILVVDDDHDAADSLALLLEMLGHEVSVSYSATEGIASAERLSPRAILHDLSMPGLNGYDAVRRLREQPRFADTLIVAVTAYSNVEARERARQVGFDGFLTKPADLDQLLAMLKSGRAGSPGVVLSD